MTSLWMFCLLLAHGITWIPHCSACHHLSIPGGFVSSRGVTCRPPFAHIPDKGGVKCNGSSGNWVGVGKCVYCHGHIRNGHLSSDGTVKCNPGYKHYPDPNGKKCNEHSHMWTGLGVCRDPTKPIVCYPPYVRYGYSYGNGDVKCVTNYRHIPHKTGKKCDSYGHWVNIGICKACTGSVANGRVLGGGKVICNAPFTYIPDPNGPKCDAAANWVGLGICRGPSCDAPPLTVANGKVHSTRNSKYRFGDTFHVTCNAGYSTNGDGKNSAFTVTCNSTGSQTFWSGSQDCAFPCPSPFGWNSDLKRCIKVLHGTYSGDAVHQACHKLSGNLIRIRNAVDNNLLFNLVKDVAFGTTWVGLRNVPSMDWVWALQPSYYESSLGDTQWNPAFPMAVHGACAGMNPGYASWRQKACGHSTSSKFVCERVACWYKDYVYDYQLARCVKLYRYGATRQQASKKCADHQANLLQISTPDEEERVKKIKSNSNANVWLGLIWTNNQYLWEQRTSPAKVAFSQAYNSFRGHMTYGSNTCVYLNNEGTGRWTVHQCGRGGRAWFMCQTTHCPRGYSYSNELGRCKDLTIRKNAAGKCRSDYTWISKDGINLCVKFVKIPASWYWAERACRLDGGVLMRPLDSATQELLGYLPNQPFWIGLNDIKNEGTFEFSPRGRWNTPGRALGLYKNWGLGGSQGGTEENCVFTSSSGWMDYACQHKYPYACQMLD